MHAPEPRLPGVSVREAAIHLGTSESDIRRRIKRGDLQAESFERRGGTLLRVLLPAPATEPPTESEAAPEPRQDVSAAITAAVEPLAERLAAQDAVIAQKDARIAALEREAGAATTRAAMLEAEAQRLRDELAVARTRPERRWWDPRTW